MREKIREVMRWSGPRMIRYRPITAVRHAMVTVQAKRAAGTKQVVAGAGTRRAAFPLDFGTRRARRVESCAITMERIHQMQRSRHARLPAGRLPHPYFVFGRPCLV